MPKHSRLTERGRCFWNTERLWALSQKLTVKTVTLDSIAEIDQNCPAYLNRGEVLLRLSRLGAGASCSCPDYML